MICEENIKRYCCEEIYLIENYDMAIKDTAQVWVCHHKLEIQNGISVSTKELKEKDLYWKRPANELIFLTRSEHTKLHGKNMSKETRIKVSIKSKQSWKNNENRRKEASIRGHAMKGKIIKTPEQCRMNSEARKRYWKTHRLKWFNNGEIAIRSEQCPKGFVPGMLYKWFNNGIVEISSKVCPEGFVPGRLLKQ